MEIEESDVFEITDYTNATDWEKFISKVEEIITIFDNSQLLDNNSIKEKHKINFDIYELNVNLAIPNIKFLENSKNFASDFNVMEIEDSLVIKENNNIGNEMECENDIHWELVKWFGNRKFVVFSPSKSISIYGQDQINQLISSITIAAVNIKCQLPIIVKYGPRNWPLYLGIQFENDFKHKMQCAIIKYTPKQFTTLSGIRRVFQDKLGKGCVFDDDIVMTAKYVYFIENCSHNNEKYFQEPIRPMQKKMHFFQYMSIGFCKDPIKNMKLVAHWSKVSKQVLIQSDLDSLPLSTVNNWYLMCESKNSLDGILYKTLRKLLKSFLVNHKSSEILQESKPQDIDTMHINQPLLKLTNFPISNHHLFEKSFGNRPKSDNPSSAASGSSRNELFDGKILQEIVLFLFPDARPDSSDSIRPTYTIDPEVNLPNFKKLQKKYPNANPSSFIHRLAICLTNLLNSHKEGLKCFSYIWMEVVLELRYRWENAIPLPTTRMSEDFKLLNVKTGNEDEIFARLLTDSMPYLCTSQLEQRFQLINYCILTRLRNQSMKTYENISDNSDSDETTEQFYDCETDNDNDLANSFSKSNQEPRGRLRKHGDLKLLNHPDTPLYVPITQVLSVDVYRKSKQMEHDQLIAFAASLIADMSAFKAANPGCVLEDFIRWYSPKDFIEVEVAKDNNGDTNSNVKGELSSRMLVANNTWLNSWEEAVPTPARLQKRLFDDTNAAEASLKWMENLTSAEISSCLINNTLLDSLYAIVECVDNQDPLEFLQQIDNASVALINFFDENDVMDVTGAELEYYQKYDKLILHFQKMEFSLTLKKSLQYKLLSDFSGSDNEKNQIVSIINHLLLSENEVNISKHLLSNNTYTFIFNRLMSMYNIPKVIDKKEESWDVDHIFTQTFQKEYLLSLHCPYPFPTSRKSNQRLYVCSNDSEFIISSNFCDDITYF